MKIKFMMIRYISVNITLNLFFIGLKRFLFCTFAEKIDNIFINI